jgi:hypothetical protein
MRNSFLNVAHQDLLAAGTAAAAGIRMSSVSPQGAAYNAWSSAVASPEPNGASFNANGTGMMSSSLAFSPVSVAARPSSALPYIGAMGVSTSSTSSSPAGDVAAGYAAGFAAAQQSMLAARRSVVSSSTVLQ